jgi:hypothetical protein
LARTLISPCGSDTLLNHALAVSREHLESQRMNGITTSHHSKPGAEFLGCCPDKYHETGTRNNDFFLLVNLHTLTTARTETKDHLICQNFNKQYIKIRVKNEKKEERRKISAKM